MEDTPVALLIVFAVLFVATHLALSSVPVRRPLIARLGDNGFRGIYTFAALGTLVAMAWAWSKAPMVPMWTVPAGLKLVPVLAMPFAALMLVWGVSTPNPTSVGGEAAGVQVKGFTAVTRHPFMAGVALWAVAHLAAKGDVASWVMFGAVLVLAVAGTLHIDARRRADPDWPAFAAATSWLPFLAIVQGRASFRWSDVGTRRIVAGLALFLALLVLHPLVIGVRPLPW
jgi:uncharacterized membrane protein